jgi:hypothetical protein
MSENNLHQEAVKMLEKYPTKIPIILEPIGIDLKHVKFLVEKEISFAKFISIVRDQNKLNSSQSFIFFINKLLPCNTSLVSDLYHKNKADDFILHIHVRIENTFG